ncbi:MAG TPA: LL-diaminopimelate aminotransferase [Anaerolineae bacterium]|nr:LL-diaminopimelate aminotransferase [Anaerolineae bacterium]
MHVSNRIDKLPPYVFARLEKRLRQLAAEGRDIIRLDMGSPDLPPPGWVSDTMYSSAQNPSHHGYSGYFGTPAFRQAICTYYERRFGVCLDPEKEVVSLIGSKEGIANIALAFVDPGELVLVPDPGYPTYSLGTFLAGGVVYPLPMGAETGWLPDLEAIPEDVVGAAKLLWLNYPNNPTGAIAPVEFLERAVAFAKKHDLLICYDNPYCDVTFDGYVAPSLLQIPGAFDVSIEFNSLSKTYNMAGWRAGMAVGNAVAVEALARTKTNIDSGIFRPIQDAAALALTGDQSWLKERNLIYAERRDVILETLDEIGLRAERPVASLYLWVQTPLGVSSGTVAERLLEEAGISVTPGTAFGSQGEGYFRISLGTSTPRIREAMVRLKLIQW